MNGVHNLPPKKIGEFMYKMIHRLTASRYILYKWKKTETDKCPICDVRARNCETYLL